MGKLLAAAGFVCAGVNMAALSRDAWHSTTDLAFSLLGLAIGIGLLWGPKQ